MSEGWQPKTWDVGTAELSNQLFAAAREKALEGLTAIMAWSMAQEAAKTLKPLLVEAEQAARSKEIELAETDTLVARRRARKLLNQVRPLRQKAERLKSHLKALQVVEFPGADALPGLRGWLEQGRS